MTRPLRFNTFGSVYHLISRFVDREWFIESDEERATYLRILAEYVRHSDWRCLAYAVMSNHIHLAMVAGATSLASWVRPAHSTFAEWMNKRRNRIGSVFTRGPKDFMIPSDYVGKTIAYIHNNPVRAGVVQRARESDWTSHRAYLGVAVPTWLHIDEGMALSGFSDAEAFDSWVNLRPGTRPDVELAALRRAARHRGTIEVGTPTVGERTEVPLIVRQWAHIRCDPRVVVVETAKELGLSIFDLCSRRRSPRIVRGRRLAVHCGTALGLTCADIAAALGISPQAASLIRRRELEGRPMARAYERVLERICPGVTAELAQVASDPLTPV